MDSDHRALCGKDLGRSKRHELRTRSFFDGVYFVQGQKLPPGQMQVPALNYQNIVFK